MKEETESGYVIRTTTRIMFEEAEGGMVGQWRYTIFEGLSTSGQQVYWLNVYPHGSIRSAELDGPQYSSIEQARSAVPGEIYKLGNKRAASVPARPHRQ